MLDASSGSSPDCDYLLPWTRAREERYEQGKHVATMPASSSNTASSTKATRFPQLWKKAHRPLHTIETSHEVFFPPWTQDTCLSPFNLPPSQPKCTSPPSFFSSSSPSYPAKEPSRPYRIPTPNATNQASTATNSSAPFSRRILKALATISTSWISAGGWRFFLTQVTFSVRRGPDSPHLGGVRMGV